MPPPRWYASQPDARNACIAIAERTPSRQWNTIGRSDGTSSAREASRSSSMWVEPGMRPASHSYGSRTSISRTSPLSSASFTCEGVSSWAGSAKAMDVFSRPVAVDLHVAERGDGNPVLLLHGFPELGYSWRHQVDALAAAGYRAIAPDMRGFGRSPAPEAVDAYDVVELCSDVLRLLDDRGLQRAAVVGHDWGATVAWHFALIHPERTACVAGISVPLVPNPPSAPLSIMREHLGEDFYIVWFQEPGVAEAALERDVRRPLLTPAVWDPEWAEQQDERPRVPPFMTEDDVAIYVAEYERTGFRGGLNWYRNIDRNWELTRRYDERTLEMPALFMAGTRDSTMKWMSPDAMRDRVPDLRVELVEGAGHWLQQERPDEVNRALLGLLRDAG